MQTNNRKNHTFILVTVEIIVTLLVARIREGSAEGLIIVFDLFQRRAPQIESIIEVVFIDVQSIGHTSAFRTNQTMVNLFVVHIIMHTLIRIECCVYIEHHIVAYHTVLPDNCLRPNDYIRCDE